MAPRGSGPRPTDDQVRLWTSECAAAEKGSWTTETLLAEGRASLTTANKIIYECHNPLQKCEHLKPRNWDELCLLRERCCNLLDSFAKRAAKRPGKSPELSHDDFMAELERTTFFSPTELKEIGAEKPTAAMREKLFSLAKSMSSSPMSLAIFKVLQSLPKKWNLDDAYLHFSPAKDFFGTHLQPSSCPTTIRDNFLKEYKENDPASVSIGLRNSKLKNWFARTKPTGIVHAVGNDSLSIGLNGFSLLVVRKKHFVAPSMEHHSVIGPVMSGTTVMPVRIYSDESKTAAAPGWFLDILLHREPVNTYYNERLIFISSDCAVLSFDVEDADATTLEFVLNQEKSLLCDNGKKRGRALACAPEDTAVDYGIVHQIMRMKLSGPEERTLLAYREGRAAPKAQRPKRTRARK